MPQELTTWGILGAAGLALALFGLMLFLNRHGQSDERRLGRAIERHAGGMIRNAVIPDGIEGYLFADYLLRMGGHIVVLNSESRKGYIFGADNIEEWTCVENNRTEKFRNPLQKATLFAHQVRHICGFDTVLPCVFFGGDSEFPKGIPDGVIPIARLDEEFEAIRGSGEDNEALEEAWTRLTALSDEGRHQLDVAL